MGGCRRTKVHLRRDTIPASTGSLCRYLYGDTSHPKDKEVFFYAEKRTMRRSRTGPRYLCPDGLRPADRAERGAGPIADHHSQRSEPLLSGGSAHSPGRTAVRAAARRRGGLCRRLYRLPVFPLWLQPDLLPAAHSVRPVGGAGAPVCLAQAYPLAGGAGGISCGGMRLRALAEHGSGAGVRWCSQMALFPHPAGGPQRSVRHHRLYRRAAGVAADAAERTLPGTAADKDEGR